MLKLLNKNSSIKFKLIGIIFFVGIIVMLSTIIVASYAYINSVKTNALEQNRANLRVLSEDMVVPLIFNDTATIKTTINQFKDYSKFNNIAVYDNLKRVFYNNDSLLYKTFLNMKNNNIDYFYSSNNLYLTSLITKDSNIIGHVIVEVSFDNIKKGIINFIKLMILLFMIFLIITYLLASNLQKIISTPIENLSRITKEITQNYDFERELIYTSSDEIGVLYENFNNLLKEIKSKEKDNQIALENIRVSEKKYRTIFEEALSGIFQLNLNGDFINLNNYFAKLLGLRNSEELKLIAKNFVTHFLKDKKKWENIQLYLNSNKRYKKEIKLYKYNGEKIDVILSLRPVFSYSKLSFIEGVCEDITHRKKQEQLLKEAKEYVDNILESMPSAIISVSKDLEITHFNSISKQYKNIKIGAKFFDIFEFLKPQQNFIEELIRNRENGKLEKQIIINSDGSTEYKDINIYSLSGDIGVVIRIDDITERIYFENMMIQTEKMMSLGGLAAGMAHEINNPLAGIMQNAQLIEMRLSKELDKNIETAKEIGLDLEILNDYAQKRGIIKNLKHIRESGLRASNIVKDMLEFSRSSSKAFEKVNINEIIDKSLELLKTDFSMKKKYDFKNTKIIKKYDPKISLIECVPNEIEQVLINLIKNASQAMFYAQTDEPKLEIITKKMSKGANIIIKDNGPGIPKDKLTRIFEPFFTTKEVGEGTGLGLSVSYFIITNNHHGMISAKSELNKGTEFTIYLPSSQENN